ncbi:MAG: glutamine synthetase, partial [Muribaculaceae bacterium]|nr:glutamine synthetase [Muribaculaceae bacterium]
CMRLIASTGGQIKYGHSEVGNFTLDGKIYEQNEIEFLPVDARAAADQLALAKWVIRNQAMREGLDVTFAPKITVGKAGSGLHVHIRLTDAAGHSVMTGEDGRLSDEARRGIAGLMDLAPALTAFGNTNPTSYFRLVPHQEAPTAVCWGDRNRSVLVRVPLGWTATGDMCAMLNPGSHTASEVDARQKQTFEIRNADGSADVYTLLAGLAVALRHGFEMPDGLKVAQATYVDVDIHKAENAEKSERLATLPVDCADSADRLEAVREIFEKHGVFPQRLIESALRRLRSYDNDEIIRAKADTAAMLDMVRKYFHCG